MPASVEFVCYCGCRVKTMLNAGCPAFRKLLPLPFSWCDSDAGGGNCNSSLIHLSFSRCIFIHGLLNDSVSSSVTQLRRMILLVKDELKETWKRAIVALRRCYLICL
jgi:hypothetical protein